MTWFLPGPSGKMLPKCGQNGRFGGFHVPLLEKRQSPESELKLPSEHHIGGLSKTSVQVILFHCSRFWAFRDWKWGVSTLVHCNMLSFGNATWNPKSHDVSKKQIWGLFITMFDYQERSQLAEWTSIWKENCLEGPTNRSLMASETKMFVSSTHHNWPARHSNHTYDSTV